jgi:hypothetical protein
MKVVVPSYFAPADPAWDAILSAGGIVGAVIANQNSGPGDTPSADWLNRIVQCQKKGIAVYGYVHTRTVPDQFGNRDINEVMSEAGRHFAWYGVNGLFLDEASTRLEDLAYFQQFSCKRILNCGTLPDEAYLQSSDMVCVFEGTADDHAQFVPPGWLVKRKNVALSIVHSVPGAKMKSVLTSVKRYARNYFLTDQTLPNPYGALPSYWVDFVKKAQQL